MIKKLLIIIFLFALLLTPVLILSGRKIDHHTDLNKVINSINTNIIIRLNNDLNPFSKDEQFKIYEIPILKKYEIKILNSRFITALILFKKNKIIDSYCYPTIFWQTYKKKHFSTWRREILKVNLITNKILIEYERDRGISAYDKIQDIIFISNNKLEITNKSIVTNISRYEEFLKERPDENIIPYSQRDVSNIKKDEFFNYSINFYMGFFLTDPKDFNELYLMDYLNINPVKYGGNFSINFGYNIFSEFFIKLGLGYMFNIPDRKKEKVDIFDGGGGKIGETYIELVPGISVIYINFRFSKIFRINKIYPEFGIDLKYGFLDYNLSLYEAYKNNYTDSPSMKDSSLSYGLFLGVQYEIQKNLLFGIECNYKYLIFDNLKNKDGKTWYWGFANNKKAIIDLSGIELLLKFSFII